MRVRALQRSVTLGLVGAFAFVTGTFTSPAIAQEQGTPSTREQLASIAVQWRHRFKSSNVGCWTPGLSKHEANAEQAATVEKLKGLGSGLMQSHPTIRGERGFDPENRHNMILAYADLVDEQSPTQTSVLAGNCGEISASLYAYLYRNYKGLELATARRNDYFANDGWVDHAFVLVKTPEGVFIVDGWRGDGGAVGPLTINSAGEFIDPSTGKPHPDYDFSIQVTSDTIGGGFWHTSIGTRSL